MIKSFVFSGGKLVGEDPGLDFVKTMLFDEDAQIWVDLDSPTPEEARSVLEQIFNFHPLAIEDCIAVSEQPKIDEYEKYLFLVVHALHYTEAHSVAPLELNLFIGRNFLVTHHDQSLPSIRATMERIKKNASSVAKASDRLTYSILDVLFDRYEPAIESLASDIAELERDVLENPNQDILSRVVQLKSEVRRFHQLVAPQREVIARLARGEFKLVRPHLLPYYRDLLDRLKRIGDRTDTYREMLTNILQIHLNLQQMEVNRVIKILTVLATLSLPLVIITGFYGMNFDGMPELNWKYPYLWILFLAVASSASIYWFLRKKRWL
ncbi:MAG TPA: magnesium/cobalt transporter CorA [Kiritimatiellia bacterium]|nr:magnesium/cobalt transporter CorA [Kiritimatiellia bacterium]HMO97740.1 magnesium/cobalt transporter CorA [Kiritimatiellia bacterium]HMP95379.1 magnesium/cobalt transporter CorA [Kiritimatiellia bacterium]